MSAEHFQTSVSGRVTDIFAHRFVVATSAGTILADLGPKGLQEVTLRVGDDVMLKGEQKPSELKVEAITIGDRTIALKPDSDDHQHPADVERVARNAVANAGFEPVGLVKHKPKHFEILGRRGDAYSEFHVELGGRIRKSKPAPPPRKEDLA
jgi:hypothetical protein